MRLLPARKVDARPEEERVNPIVNLEAQFVKDLPVEQREFALCVSHETTVNNELKT